MFLAFPMSLADGRRAVVCDPDGIFLLDLQTKQARRLLAVPGQLFAAKPVGVTKEQRFITLTETGTEGNVWLLSFHQ